MQKFKPKVIEEKEKTRPQDKRIVTRPTALKFKSRPDEENKKSRSKKNKAKKSQSSLRQIPSVNNSPTLSKKQDENVKDGSLKTFISNQKASIKKRPKDINIEIYEPDSLPRKSDTKASLLPQRKKDPTRKDKENSEKRENKENNDKKQPQRAAPSHPPRDINKIEEESEDARNSSSKERGGSGSSTKQAPTLVCYICSREFGTRSISIHEPQCLEVSCWKLLKTNTKIC